MTEGSPPRLRGECLTALLRLYSLERDLAATVVVAGLLDSSAERAALAKRGVFDGVRAETVELAEKMRLSNAAVLRSADVGPELDEAILAALADLGRMDGALRGADLLAHLLDASPVLVWPSEDIRWCLSSKPSEFFTESVAAYAPNETFKAGPAVDAYHSAFSRLKKDAIPLALQASIGVLTAGVHVATAGMSTAATPFIAAHAHALGASAFAAKMGAKKVAVDVVVAQESPMHLIHEVAKMDVASELGFLQPTDLLDQLRTLESDLREQLGLIAEREGRGDRLLGHARDGAGVVMEMFQSGGVGKALAAPDLIQVGKNLKDEMPTKEERNLAYSIRAVEYEIRHLTSPQWKRNVAKGTRFFGVPALSKLLDHIDD